MKKTTLRTLVASSVAALGLAGSVSGATWSTTTGGATPAEALDWSDAANWGGEAPPNGSGAIANFSALTGDTYIRLTSPVTLGKIENTGSGRPIFIGDVTMLFLSGTASPSVTKATFYTDVRFDTSGDVYLDANNVTLCGDSAFSPYLRNNSASISYRADLYAKSSDPVRVNPFSFNGWGRCVLNYYSVTWVAPKGAEAVVGRWTRTAGSPYLTFAGETLHALAAGTRVSGEGFDAAAEPFLKRIFPDGTIELSAAATSSGTDELIIRPIT